MFWCVGEFVDGFLLCLFVGVVEGCCLLIWLGFGVFVGYFCCYCLFCCCVFDLYCIGFCCDVVGYVVVLVCFW